MIQRILTALVLIPLVLLLILRAPGWALSAVAGIAALLAIREFLGLTRRFGVEPLFLSTYLFTAFFFFYISGFSSSYVPGFFVGIAPFFFLAVGMRRGKLQSIYPSAAASVFAFVYIAVPMKMLILLRNHYLIYLMIVVWSGDISAYFVGKSLGTHKLAPRISPGKTWEGAAASFIASVTLGTLFCLHLTQIGQSLIRWHLLTGDILEWSDMHPWSLGGAVLVSCILNVAAQLGDLVESAIKRGADVKDSGAILPGHGGMLDRIDALLFVAPVLWWYSIASIFALGTHYMTF